MREPLEIIEGIKAFISSQNPFRFPHQEEAMLNLIVELENSLNPPVEVEPVVEEPIVEETPIVEEVIEEPVVEATPVVKEVVVKAPKRNAKKK